MMRVLVTGATGRLGKALLPRLAGSGLTVRAMSRSPRSAPGAEWTVADLATGANLRAALEDVDTVVHLASAPYKGRYTRKVDLEGTGRLIEAAREAGAAHLVFPSIVGIDEIAWGYFGTKAAAESLVRSSGVPWSTIRMTQFHPFVDEAFTQMARLRVLVADPGIAFRPVDIGDAAAFVLDRVLEGPTKAIEEFGGPETLTMAEAAVRWREARAARCRILRVKLPGAAGRTMRAGHLATGATPTGTTTWQTYLEGREPTGT
ncbi:SDR family oxidoreductase [Spirillospora sp. CA-253888]